MDRQKASSAFLESYFREMNYLREAGDVFAHEHPKIAGRLRLDGSETADPHVERLLEGFAFLSARLQQNIDNVASEVTDALLDVLYPHLSRPLPALSVAQFQVSPDHTLPPSSGTLVEAGTEVFAYSKENSICRFSTVYPFKLLPISLEACSLVSKGAYQFVPAPNTLEFGYGKYAEIPSFFLELTLASLEGFFKDLTLDSLLFYLNIRSSQLKKMVYQALFSTSSLVYCSRGDEHVALPLLPHSLKAMGFEREEAALPPAEFETHAYTLLQEFFHFPDKFMFFQIRQLQFLQYLRNNNFLQTQRIKLLIPLQKASNDWARVLEPQSILLNCTPIINLHKVTTDPISWDKKQTFYHLTPNMARERTQEIYRILEVFSVNPEEGTEKRICPYFSLERDEEPGHLFWWSRLVPTRQLHIQGVDSWITFVDDDGHFVDPTTYIMYAKALCTNRFLAEDIPQGAVLQLDKALPIEGVVCLQKPVFPQYVLDKGANNMRLIAQLSTRYLGFPYGDADNRAGAIRRILDLHTGPSNKEYGTILLDQLKEVRVEETFKRLPGDPQRGLREGVCLHLDIKRSQREPDWFLLARVLHRYFAVNCQINTFVDLKLTEEGVPLASFEDVLGEQRSI